MSGNLFQEEMRVVPSGRNGQVLSKIFELKSDVLKCQDKESLVKTYSNIQTFIKNFKQNQKNFDVFSNAKQISELVEQRIAILNNRQILLENLFFCHPQTIGECFEPKDYHHLSQLNKNLQRFVAPLKDLMTWRKLSQYLSRSRCWNEIFILESPVFQKINPKFHKEFESLPFSEDSKPILLGYASTFCKTLKDKRFYYFYNSNYVRKSGLIFVLYSDRLSSQSKENASSIVFSARKIGILNRKFNLDIQQWDQKIDDLNQQLQFPYLSKNKEKKLRRKISKIAIKIEIKKVQHRQIIDFEIKNAKYPYGLNAFLEENEILIDFFKHRTGFFRLPLENSSHKSFSSHLTKITPEEINSFRRASEEYSDSKICDCKSKDLLL